MATRAAKTTRKRPKSEAEPAKSASAPQRAEEHEGGARGIPRALWTGSLGFGLLQIPVSLHTATSADEIRFHQLDDRTLDPVGYKRVNKATGEEVEWEHIVRGYEVEKGEYVVVTDEDLAAADVEATQTIDIVDFVDADAIDRVFDDKPYYLAPGKRADRAYALFREALLRTKRVAIAKVVIRTRQHLAMVYPRGRALVLEILRWRHEVRSPKGLELPDEDISALKVTDRELDMARELIDRMTTDWDPSRYTDEYRDRVLAVIEEKARTGEVTEVHTKTEREVPSRAADLADLLKRSLERSPEPGPKPTPKRRGRAA